MMNLNIDINVPNADAAVDALAHIKELIQSGFEPRWVLLGDEESGENDDRSDCDE